MQNPRASTKFLIDRETWILLLPQSPTTCQQQGHANNFSQTLFRKINPFVSPDCPLPHVCLKLHFLEESSTAVCSSLRQSRQEILMSSKELSAFMSSTSLLLLTVLQIIFINCIPYSNQGEHHNCVKFCTI